MTGISEIWRHEDTKSMVSKLLVALIVIRNSAFFDRNFWNWKDMKTQTLTLFLVHNESSWARQKRIGARLLIALIVIRNSAFYCDRNFWNLKAWRHKKYGVKTFSCSPELFVTHLTMKKKSKTLCFNRMVFPKILCNRPANQYHRQISLWGFFHATSEKKTFLSIDSCFQDKFDLKSP